MTLFMSWKPSVYSCDACLTQMVVWSPTSILSTWKLIVQDILFYDAHQRLGALFFSFIPPMKSYKSLPMHLPHMEFHSLSSSGQLLMLKNIKLPNQLQTTEPFTVDTSTCIVALAMMVAMEMDSAYPNHDVNPARLYPHVSAFNKIVCPLQTSVEWG